MKRFLPFLAFCSVLFAASGADALEFRSERARRDAILWQARSCIGEIGWHDVATCVSMTYVHMDIAERTDIPLERVVRQFSAAVKPQHNVNRPWIFELDWNGRRPSMMRRGSWERWRRTRWLATLSIVADTVDGLIAPHCFGARSYGSARLDANPNPQTLERRDCLPGSGQAFWFWKEEHDPRRS